MADDFTANINTTGRLDSGLAAGNLEVIGDHDWFRVRLYAGHNYIIDQRGSPSGGGTLTDPFLAIRDSAGNLITSNDDVRLRRRRRRVDGSEYLPPRVSGCDRRRTSRHPRFRLARHICVAVA